MPVRAAHFIITPFCIRGGRWLDHVDGNVFKNVNPLRPRSVDLRLKLLETTNPFARERGGNNRSIRR